MFWVKTSNIRGDCRHINIYKSPRNVRNFNNLASIPSLDNLNNLGKTISSASLSDKPITGGNPPTNNDLLQSEYDFTYRMFPENLGEQSSIGHYMIINIAASTRSNMETVTDPTGRQIRNFTPLNEYSRVDTLRQNIDPNWKGKDGSALSGSLVFGVDGQYGGQIRNTRRIKEAIALYMPSTVAFSSQAQYEDVSLTALAKGVAASLPGKLGTFANKATDMALAGAQLMNVPINPKVEVFFSNVAQRVFQFDFLMAPTSETESIAMEQIIKTLRFHQAPEINSFGNTLANFFMIPPSEFDLSFFNRGIENTKIPRINTCVLESIDVDYAPSGVYATFTNGYPVSLRMQLRFREIEIIHKLRVLQGF